MKVAQIKHKQMDLKSSFFKIRDHPHNHPKKTAACKLYLLETFSQYNSIRIPNLISDEKFQLYNIKLLDEDETRNTFYAWQAKASHINRNMHYWSEAKPSPIMMCF